jgi:hypothetical protein
MDKISLQLLHTLDKHMLKDELDLATNMYHHHLSLMDYVDVIYHTPANKDSKSERKRQTDIANSWMEYYGKVKAELEKRHKQEANAERERHNAESKAFYEGIGNIEDVARRTAEELLRKEDLRQGLLRPIKRAVPELGREAKHFVTTLDDLIGGFMGNGSNNAGEPRGTH